MLKYFDNTFFKFLFGFLAILAMSFALLLFTQWWSDREAVLSTSNAQTAEIQY